MSPDAQTLAAASGLAGAILTVALQVLVKLVTAGLVRLIEWGKK